MNLEVNFLDLEIDFPVYANFTMAQIIILSHNKK